MKRKFNRGLGGAAVTLTLIATSIVSCYQMALAEEVSTPGSQEIVILDGPGLLETPTDPAPPLPPREDPPAEKPTETPTEPPVFNPGFEPSNPPGDAPRETPVQTPTPTQTPGETSAPTPVANPTPDASPRASESIPVQEVIETSGAETKTATEAPVLVSKPLAISIPAKVVSAPIALGSAVITPSAKAALAKMAGAVMSTGRPVSISVKTSGTTIAKATAQAKAIAAELRKRGVAAVTVLKRVGNKTSVSVLVTKKP